MYDASRFTYDSVWTGGPDFDLATSGMERGALSLLFCKGGNFGRMHRVFLKPDSLMSRAMDVLFRKVNQSI